MLKIVFCDHCGVWAAWLVCPCCKSESRQIGIEGDWSAAAGMNLDPADDVQGDIISCGWCGAVMYVDEMIPRTKGSGKSYSFAVDFDGVDP